MRLNWTLTETEFIPDQLHRQETLFSIGNGYIGTRGTFEEGFPNENSLSLISGLYDDVPIYNTELVNIANWLDLTFFINGEPFRLDRGRILHYQRQLDLHSAILSRSIRWRNPTDATFDLYFERFVSLHDPHTLALYMTITSIDYKGEIEIQSRLGGHVDNAGYQHWLLQDQGFFSPNSAFLQTITKSTQIEIVTAFHMNILGRTDVFFEPKDDAWIPGQLASTVIEPGQTIKIEKIVSVFTSLETNPGDSLLTFANDHLEASVAKGYHVLKNNNKSAWEREWELCNVTIEGDDKADFAVRFNLYHLLISAPRWSEYVSQSESGLTGLRHFGHIFWETEALCLPFFTLVQPHIARNLLLYRYHTLNGSRKKALENGYKGSMYAWESAKTGEENTPRWMPSAKNSLELDRIWCGELQQHISANIAFGVYFYWKWTQDHNFLKNYGAEIILDTARFWSSRLEWNATLNRYEINDIIGPDEYHLRVNNNAFTNRLAAWNLEKACWVMDWLKEKYPDHADYLCKRLILSESDIIIWKEMSDSIFFPQNQNTGLIEQFEGYFDCENINLEEYEPRYQPIQNILGVQRTQQYQVIRQPDVLMLLYLLDHDALENVLKINWEYYVPRTDIDFGSSTGHAIHACLAARLGKTSTSYNLFLKAAFTNLHDLNNDLCDGIQPACAGGVWQSIIFGFAGLALNDDCYITQNRLPATWSRLSFSFFYRDHPCHITIENPNPINLEFPIQEKIEKPKIKFEPEPLNDYQLKKQRAYDVLIRNLQGMNYRCKNNPFRSMEIVNESCYKITGFFPSEIIKDRKVAYGNIIHPADRDFVWNDIQTALADNQSYWLIYRIITASGEEKWVWDQGQHTQNGVDLEGIIVSLSDGREGSQTILNIAERLETLHTIYRSILEVRIPGDVIQIALKQIKRLVPYDFASLILFSETSGPTIVYLENGQKYQFPTKFSAFLLQQKEWLVRNRQGRIFSDNSEWVVWIKRAFKNLKDKDINTYMILPLVSSGDILGVLVMCTYQPRSLSSIHVDIANEVVSSITINVREYRLFQEVSESGKRSQILSQQLVRVQEVERRRLAHELHDEIGQSLTVVKMNLCSIKKKTPAVNKYLDECINIVEGTLQQVRNLSLDLRPAMLDDLGLAITLRWFLERITQFSDIKTHFSVDIKHERYSEVIETSSFRIVQEALSNIIRHSAAKNTWVTLHQSAHDSPLILTVEDDGCGYNVKSAMTKASKGQSLGLLGMHERVLLSGGHIDIRSKRGQGTIINVVFPHPNLQTPKESD